MGLPWKSSDWDTALPMQGPWVRSLVMELRSHMSCGKAKKKKSCHKRESGFEDQQKWCFGLSIFSSLWFTCKPTNNWSESYAQIKNTKNKAS